MPDRATYFHEFTQNCRRTWTADETTVDENIQRFRKAINLVHATDGICTEAGEIKDILKRFLFYGSDMDRTHVVEELGDLMHYMVIFVDEVNKFFPENPICLEEAMKANTKKLRARYPDGFTKEAANNRNVRLEYEAMTDANPCVHE